MSKLLQTGAVEYDIGLNDSVSAAVTRAVSALIGCKQRSMRPLADVVDTDALDALFAEQNEGEPRSGGRISFVYEDCRVTVDNGEYLTVQPLRIQPRTAGDGAPDGADTK